MKEDEKKTVFHHRIADTNYRLARDTYNAAFQISALARNSIFLLNGGAAITLMTFIGIYFEKFKAFDQAVTICFCLSLVLFIIGLLVILYTKIRMSSALFTLARYQSQIGYLHDLASFEGSLKENDLNETEGSCKEKLKNAAKSDRNLTVAAFVSFVSGLAVSLYTLIGLM